MRKLGELPDGSGGPLSYNDLKRVRDMVAEEGGVDKVTALLDKVDAMAKKVGNLARLRFSLNALNELGQKP